MGTDYDGYEGRSDHRELGDKKNEPVSELKGSSFTMRRVREQIRIEAKNEGHVLILGETGTGKELVARGIFEAMKAAGKAGGELVAVSCATFGGDERMAESELFGHSKGAFTGAREPRPGLIETAGSGVLFLDDLQDLPEPVAAKLNRTIETRDYRRVGDDVTRKAECRFVAASNAAPKGENILDRVSQTLEGIVERTRVDAILKNEGRLVERDRVGDLIELFLAAHGQATGEAQADIDRPWGMRRDFFERFDGRIEITPLRDRLDDLAELFFEFLDVECRRNDKGAVAAIPMHVAVNLLAYDWPGNVRELKAGVGRLVRYWDWEMGDSRRLFTDMERVWCMPAGDFWSLLVRLTGSAAYAFPLGPEAWYRVLNISRSKLLEAAKQLAEKKVPSRDKTERLKVVCDCIEELELDKTTWRAHLFTGEAAKLLADLRRKGREFWRTLKNNGFGEFIQLEDPASTSTKWTGASSSPGVEARRNHVDWLALAKSGLKLKDVRDLYLGGLIASQAGNIAAAARSGGISESTLHRFKKGALGQAKRGEKRK